MATLEKYGIICETKADRRGVSALYSGDGAHGFTFALCDWADALNAKGKTGAEARRAHLAAAAPEDREKYMECHTIGTPWVEVNVPTSTFFDLSADKFAAFFTKSGQVKLKPEATDILRELVALRKATIVAKHKDYVLDLYDAWKAEGGNFGYGYEVFKVGKSNRNTADRVDGQDKQFKACFTLYRTEERPNSANKKPYAVGTNDGVSTANGVR